jgi:hypothetical protein
MMRSRLKRRLIIGGTVLATAGLAGGAYAATQSSGPSRQAFLNDVSKRLHVTPQQLTSALKSALLDQLQAAVSAGKLTQSQANAIKQRVEQGGLPPFVFGAGGFGGAPGGPRLGGPGFLFHGHAVRFGAGGALGTAASYLGLTRTQLLGQLSSGKTLAQIATSRRKSVSGLEQAMVAGARAKLDKLVADQTITKTREQQILNDLSAAISRQVNDAPPHFGGGRFFGPRGHGGGGGPVPPPPPNGASGPIAPPGPGPTA